jgi:peptidoglycan/LPS O-acetylase OafA/YrhL
VIPLWPSGRQRVALSDVFRGHDNLFTLIRLLLAGAVAVEHAFVNRLPPGAPAPLEWHDFSLSYAGVNAFFILSGFLISDSLQRRKSLEAYSAARILRIYPALIVLVFLAIIFFGPLFSGFDAAEYWWSPGMWRFPAETLTFVNGEGGPPGIFPSSHFPGEFSASLWTLRYEIVAYLVLPIFSAIPLISGRWARLALPIVLASTYELLLASGGEAVWSATMVSFARLGACFALGMAIYSFREALTLGWAIPVGLTLLWATLAGGTFAGELVGNAAIAAWMFTLAFASKTAISRLQSMPDYSYGLYIWHWPMMQVWGELDTDATALETLAFALPTSLILAALSWHIIERPALDSKRRLARLFENMAGRRN